MVQDRYNYRVAPVGADRLLLEDIRQMALQLNMLNSHCKPVEIVYNKNHRDADAQISWIGMRSQTGQECGLLIISPVSLITLEEELSYDGKVYVTLKEKEEL